MNIRTKIILPAVIAFAGVVTVMIGQSASVGADTTTVSTSSSLYVLLTAAGFLLVSIGAIVALFIIASGEDGNK